MKTVKNVIYFFLVLSLLTNCKKKEDNVEEDVLVKDVDKIETVDVNEYQVYSVLLNVMFSDTNNLVVKQKTGGRTYSDRIHYKELISDCSSFDTTIINNIIAKNDTVYNLENKFESSKRTVQLISSEEIQSISNSQDPNMFWSELRKKYPKSNGLIKLSRVGFNSTKTQAIVEIEHQYASLGGSGCLVYLMKESNIWKVVKIFSVIVS